MGWIGFINDAIDWVLNKLSGAKDWILDKLGGVKDWILEKLSGVKDWILDKFSSAKDWVLDRLSDVWNAILTARAAIKEAIEGVISKLGELAWKGIAWLGEFMMGLLFKLIEPLVDDLARGFDDATQDTESRRQAELAARHNRRVG